MALEILDGIRKAEEEAERLRRAAAAEAREIVAEANERAQALARAAAAEAREAAQQIHRRAEEEASRQIDVKKQLERESLKQLAGALALRVPQAARSLTKRVLADGRP